MQNRLAKLAKHLVPRRLVPFQNPELAAANRQGLGPVFRRTVRFDQTNFLPRIAVPTLLLWGEHDRAVPVKLAQEALQLIPGSELIVLPGAGHTAHFENLGLFYGIISRFLSKHEHPFPIH